MQQLPEPKGVIKAAMRAEVARLIADARPGLKLQRGRAEPIFSDPRADFGLSPHSSPVSSLGSILTG